MQKATHRAADYAALPEALVRAWTQPAFAGSERVRAEEAGDLTESLQGAAGEAQGPGESAAGDAGV